MNFLLNMNLPRELIRRFNDKGHKCRHVANIGMAQASDLAIVEEARINKEAIVTQGIDSSTLRGRMHFTPPWIQTRYIFKSNYREEATCPTT